MAVDRDRQVADLIPTDDDRRLEEDVLFASILPLRIHILTGGAICKATETPSTQFYFETARAFAAPVSVHRKAS